MSLDSLTCWTTAPRSSATGAPPGKGMGKGTTRSRLYLGSVRGSRVELIARGQIAEGAQTQTGAGCAARGGGSECESSLGPRLTPADRVNQSGRRCGAAPGKL